MARKQSVLLGPNPLDPDEKERLGSSLGQRTAPGSLIARDPCETPLLQIALSATRASEAMPDAQHAWMAADAQVCALKEGVASLPTASRAHLLAVYRCCVVEL
jgi:hypothetical protein